MQNDGPEAMCAGWRRVLSVSRPSYALLAMRGACSGRRSVPSRMKAAVAISELVVASRRRRCMEMPVPVPSQKQRTMRKDGREAMLCGVGADEERAAAQLRSQLMRRTCSGGRSVPSRMKTAVSVGEPVVAVDEGEPRTHKDGEAMLCGVGMRSVPRPSYTLHSWEKRVQGESLCR